MINKKSNNQKNLNPNKFKFKIYWIYAIIFIFFIGIQLFNSDATKKTNFKYLNDKMLQQGKVEKITIINNEKAFIYIKKEFLSEEEFKNVSKKTFGESQNLGPHFYINIGTVDNFEKKLENAQKDFDYEDQIDLSI